MSKASDGGATALAGTFSVSLPPGGALEAFRDQICCGKLWPVPSLPLAALVDVEISDACIGR